MQDFLNFDNSLPFAIVLSFLLIAKAIRPIVYAIATLLLTRKADPDTRLKVLEVYCNSRSSVFPNIDRVVANRSSKVEDD